MPYRILFILFLLIVNFNSWGQVPVMLHVNRSHQPYTAITNFPAELAVLVHTLLHEEKIILWDSPKKELKLNLTALQNLEKNAGSEFASATDLFIYEIWNTGRKSNKIEIAGISFTSKNQEGKETFFGFIEYENLLPHLRTNINVNVNGSYVTVYEDIFRNKWYDFTVVQYGEKTIQSLAESEKIINSDIKKKKLINERKIPLSKKIIYEVVKSTTSDDLLAKKSQSLIFAFEKFFTENSEIFLNFGGREITGQPDSIPIYVNKVELEELWVKDSQDKIQYLPVNVRIYANESAMDLIPFTTCHTWKITVNGKELEEFIKEKKFIFTIKKINNQQIAGSEAGLYQQALYNDDWNRLTAYVKNF